MRTRVLCLISLTTVLICGCTTTRKAAPPLIDRKQPIPTEGSLPIRSVTEAELNAQQLQQVEDAIFDQLDQRWNTAVKDFTLELYEDDRKHLSAFVIYDYSPLSAWEGGMSDAEHDAELDRIDAQIEACEERLNARQPPASEEEYQDCVRQAYPASMHPYLSELTGMYCTELRLARYDLGPIEELRREAPFKLREVHDLSLGAPLCEINQVLNFQVADLDRDGLLELSFNVEANLPDAARNVRRDHEYAQIGFVVDASRGKLQWQETITPPHSEQLGRYRFIAEQPKATDATSSPKEIEVERYTLTAPREHTITACRDELIEQLNQDAEQARWPELKPPEGCSFAQAKGVKQRYRYARSLDKWERVN